MVTPPGGSWTRYLGFALLRIALLVYVGYGFLLWWKQEDFIYHPNDQVFDQCEPLAHTEHLNLDGTRAYYKYNASSSMAVVLYHGNEGSACDREFYTSTFDSLQYSYLIVEYTGYTDDGQKPSKAAVLKDVDRVAAFVDEQNFEHVVVMGASIGSGAASYHASLSDIDNLILITPFDSIASVAGRMLPMYPVSWMLREDYDNFKYAHDVKRVCVLHGTEDTVIPIVHARALFTALKTDQKDFYSIPGADHGNIYGEVAFYTGLRACLDPVRKEAGTLQKRLQEIAPEQNIEVHELL